MAKIQNTATPNADKNVEDQEFSVTMGMQNGTDSLEDSGQFLTKLNILLPYDPAIALLGIYTKEIKTYVYTKTCM